MDKKYILMIFAFLVGYAFISLIISDKKVNNEESYSNETNSESDLNSGDMWYDILEVSPNSTLEEIKKAYLDKITKYHPDKVISLGKELQLLAEEKTKQINKAYSEALKIKKD